MNQRIKENLNIRFKHLSKEIRVRNRSRIDKRKYYGVKTEMDKYQKLILDNLYNKEAINRLIRSQENFQEYLNLLNEKILNLRDDIKEILLNVIKKGSKRVLDKNGNVLKFEELEDTDAVDLLTNQQMDYLRNTTKAQQEKIRKILVEGKKTGKPINEISERIHKEVKGITKTRATTIARTEIIKTSNLAQVNTMKQLGAQRYIYWTAGDKKVCKICKENQGSRTDPNIYNLSEAGKTAPLPVVNSHPNCRCTLLIAD